jgi:hypothetical protein
MKSVYFTKKKGLLFAVLLATMSAVLVSCGGGYSSSGGYGGTMTTAAPGAFSMMSPSPVNGMTGVGTTPTFAWSPSANALGYRVEVDTTGIFTGPFTINALLGATTYTYTVTAATLTTGTTYNWRIVAENIYGQTIAGPRTFTP